MDKILERLKSALDSNDPKAIAEITREIAASDDEGLIEAFGKAMSGTSSGIEEIDALASRTQKKLEDNRVKDEFVKQGINVVGNTIDLVTSRNQIREAKRIEEGNIRPAAPLSFQRNPALAQALNQSQLDMIDPQGLAEMQFQKDAISEGFNADINSARVASTGQAGTMGALSQAAATRRNKGLRDLALTGNQVRAQSQGRFDSLLGKTLQEDQLKATFDRQDFYNDQDIYLQEQLRANELGALGRQNQRSAVRSLLGNAGEAMLNFDFSQFANRKKDAKELAKEYDGYLDGSMKGVDYIQGYNPLT